MSQASADAGEDARHGAESVLRERSAERLAAILANLPGFLYATDPDGAIKFSSRTPYQAEDAHKAVGMRFLDLLTEETRAVAAEQLRRVARTGSSSSFEVVGEASGRPML